jgi:hypothetical protein
MEQFPVLDYGGALAVYTPAIVGVLQVLKQSPKIDNSKLPYFAVALGIIMALGMLITTGRLAWTPAGLYFQPTEFLKTLVEGIFGGSMGPSVYSLQKQLPFNILTAGPDNFGIPKPTEIKPTQEA